MMPFPSFPRVPTSSRLALVSAASLLFASCSFYQPLDDPELYPSAREAAAGDGVKVTYFGNTTILISDGTTKLLVDGFFSRPGAMQVGFGKVSPDYDAVRRQLELAGIDKVDALLIGHTHYDHALDAPFVAERTEAVVAGSVSYSAIHWGSGAKMDESHLLVVPPEGRTLTFGRFTVTFRPSGHVSPHLPKQDQMVGPIEGPIKPPAPATDYKCGDVFALHVAHPDGKLAITTSAGARKGQYAGLQADVVMLSVGSLAMEAPQTQEAYWKETVGTLNPRVVIPVHWDDLTRKLDGNAEVRSNLKAPALTNSDETERAMAFVKDRKGDRDAWVMGLRDSFLLSGGQVRIKGNLMESDSEPEAESVAEPSVEPEVEPSGEAEVEPSVETEVEPGAEKTNRFGRLFQKVFGER